MALAFVARPTTLPKLPDDAGVLPLRPEVRSDGRRQIASRPEDVLEPSDGTLIEKETERIVERWWISAGANLFTWRGVNLAECFSDTLRWVVRDLLKAVVIVDRSVEKHRPASLITDVSLLRGPLPAYPHLDGIGSIIQVRAKAMGLPCRFIGSEEVAAAAKRSRSALTRPYVHVSSRWARSVLRKQRILLALGPHAGQYRPIASVWEKEAGWTVVLTTDREPMRSAPRLRLFAAALGSFVNRTDRREVLGFMRRALTAAGSAVSAAALGERWHAISGALLADVQGRIQSELPDLTAAGLAFDREIERAVGVLLMETATPLAKAVVRYAGRLGIPRMVIQHGIIAAPDIYRRTEGDSVAAWGPVDAQWFRNHLSRAARVEATGCPRYDAMVLWRNRSHTGRSAEWARQRYQILFASQPFVQDRPLRSPWDRAALIRMAIEGIARLPDAELVIKWHPSEAGESVVSNQATRGRVRIARGGTATQLILEAAAVLVISSTIALEAMLLARPVLFLGPRDPESPFAPPEDGGGIRVDSADGLAAVLDGLVRDPAARAKVLEGQDEFLASHYAALDGKAAERVVSLLRSR